MDTKSIDYSLLLCQASLNPPAYSFEPVTKMSSQTPPFSFPIHWKMQENIQTEQQHQYSCNNLSPKDPSPKDQHLLPDKKLLMYGKTPDLFCLIFKKPVEKFKIRPVSRQIITAWIRRINSCYQNHNSCRQTKWQHTLSAYLRYTKFLLRLH